jgi:hypothetical protein
MASKVTPSDANDVPFSLTNPLRVSEVAGVGGIAWQAPVAVTMTGASKTFVPANTARKALQMWNPSGNSAGAIDLAGGTVVLATSVPFTAGLVPVYIDGPATPTGIVTAIGTNTQVFYYQEGL